GRGDRVRGRGGGQGDDGAPFCIVCGSRAADGRDGLAASQPVSVTGSEITTVLPVFAPPEPLGMPAPAIATDRSAERSIVGVGPRSPPGWADHPPAPAGADASPPWSWADAPPAPGTVTSGPPWAQAGSSPAPSAASADKSGPPWEQAGSSPGPGAAGAVKSGPPWD